MSAKETWIGCVPDIFGYGMTVCGTSRDQCLDALYTEWKEWRKGRQNPDLARESFDESFEEWGGFVKKINIGKVYYDNFKE